MLKSAMKSSSSPLSSPSSSSLLHSNASAQVGNRPAGPASRKYALSNRCTSADREAINRCEDESRRDWDVRDTDYYTPTRKFCCFAWDTLSCELRIAQRCDPNYAAELRRSASCALRWWSVMLIVIALIAIIAVVLFVVYRKRQSKFTYDYETVTRK
ncbi:hypothetical protein TYRP_003378 [Tyrophagus putrescentiae]|nr:hypothetical protein TYRP_003378 [Tyrophagus putrescentiae]